MSTFFERILTETLLFDGSMGALLAQLGHGSNCPDELASTMPEVIRGIHQSYLDAGANVILADTFGASEMVLAHKGRSGKSAAFTKAAVKLAKAAAGENAYVAVDAGPTGEFMAPIGSYNMEDFFQNFLVQMRAAKEAGADFAMIETQTDAAEARSACLAARAAGLDAAVSFTFQNGKTLSGSSPECCALIAKAAGAKAVGVNCSSGPSEMLPIVKAMKRVCDLPVIVQPNAGLPKTATDGKTYYPFSPEELLESMRPIVEAGADAVGGCCGTTPAHIALLKTLTGAKAAAQKAEIPAYICSARAYYPLEEALEARVDIGDSEDMYDLEPEDMLAVLDLSGLSAEEAEALTVECAAFGKTPLAFKVEDPSALESALRAYAGKAVVFADSALLPICEMYGAVLQAE